MKHSFLPTSILLPNSDVNLEKWSVVACDQFTSNKKYWNKVEKIVGEDPSSLNIIYPEAYLSEGEERIKRINLVMREYNANILEEKVKDGFVLVVRETESGTRLGLIGQIDLENYHYDPSVITPIRATEGTIESRIPPRKKIRKDAIMELPHVMVLVDDINQTLIEPLYERRQSLFKLYDFDLMQNGGHISGYAIDGQNAENLSQLINEYEDQSNGFFLAVGDGNHSLATAKACWEDVKLGLSEEEKENHPARFALVEMVNLHSNALKFEPIHRVVFNCDPKDLCDSLEDFIDDHNMMLLTGEDVVIVTDTENHYEIDNKQGRLPVDVLQEFLDGYVASHPECEIDYIHGEDEVKELVNDHTVGFLLGPIVKDTLFSAIQAGGVLPRKTFSMGTANEKRYYLEARRITR